MKTSFDTDGILFGILNSKTSINGGCYVRDERPDNSVKEDIVVNTIDLTQDFLPQIGTSNINIFVNDTSKTIRGVKQVSANGTRLKALTNEVLELLKSAKIDGLIVSPSVMTIMAEPTVKQHFVNIRVNWNIQK